VTKVNRAFASQDKLRRPSGEFKGASPLNVTVVGIIQVGVSGVDVCYRAASQTQCPAALSVVERQEVRPACKMLSAGLLVMTIWPELCASYSSSCHHHLNRP